MQFLFNDKPRLQNYDYNSRLTEMGKPYTKTVCNKFDFDGTSALTSKIFDDHSCMAMMSPTLYLQSIAAFLLTELKWRKID